VIHKAAILRLYPNREQGASLRRWTGGLRFVWNATLAWCNEQRTVTGMWPNKSAIQAFVVNLKKQEATAWVAGIPSHALLSLATDCHRAFGNWFGSLSGKRAGPKVRKPRFKGRNGKAPSVYMVNQATTFEAGAVRLPKLGRLRFRGGTLPQGRLLSSRVYGEAGKWFMASVFECAAEVLTIAPIACVGIDMGLSRLATVYDGAAFHHVENPQALRRHAVRLARYQRRMSRRKPGSHRRHIARLALARLHQRIANIRRDVAHKATSEIVATAQTIKVETLNLKGMVRNRHLARAVSDASMGLFVNMLAWKAQRAAPTFIKADQWFASTRTCSGCGQLHDLPLATRQMRCECGIDMDRDENAAVNLFGYSEEPRNLLHFRGKTRRERGEQDARWSPPVPLVELRILKRHGANAPY
jgi:putative transposase